ncbi:MAG: MBL fold metallo-hydrolase [Deltaproteobacteria bacterium]|nr:MBL fold metallo-hydrolase [Deltaproteobacteria bacterium]
MELVFLGTGAGNGVPEFYCNCKVCMEALEDSRCRRTRCAVVLCGEGNLLFDAPPELSSQLLRERLNRIDCFFLTHAHHDHCAALGDLELYARFHRKDRLPSVMSPETFEELGRRHGSVEEWMNVVPLQAGETLQRFGVSITAVEVAHSRGTLGYLIGTSMGRTAYLPDTGPLPDRTRDLLTGIENLILDATFWGENWYPGEHLSFEQTIQTAQELNVEMLYLTHLSMHYGKPVTSREIESAIEPYRDRVRLAYDGMRISLG